MTRRILENLTRQAKALKVLLHLQEEEFAHLSEFRPQSVGALEFSIQELMRQILSERTNVRVIAKALISTEKFGYALPFEVISILLLAAMVGAIILAKKRKD